MNRQEYQRTAGHPPPGVPLTSIKPEDMRPVNVASGCVIKTEQKKAKQ